MREDEVQGLSVAALVWATICLVQSISSAIALVVLGAATTSTSLTRSEVLAVMGAASLVMLVFPASAAWMGSVGSERAVRQETRGAGLGDAATIIAGIAAFLLVLGFCGGLVAASQNSHFQ